MSYEPIEIEITNNAGNKMQGGMIGPWSGKATMLNYKDGYTAPNRPMVVVKVNGHNVPFYLSSGEAGKDALGVSSGKWYPIFGINEESGWVNKGTIAEMKTHYGSPELKAIADHLDSTIGDIRGNKALIRELPEFNRESLKTSPQLREAIQGSFQQYNYNSPDNANIRAKNLEILKTPKTLPPPPTSTAMPDTPKPKPTPKQNSNRWWQSAIKEHLYSLTTRGTNFDGSLAEARSHLQDLKTGGKSTGIFGPPQTLADMQGKYGQYPITSAEEEAILKEVADKAGETRLEKAKFAVELEEFQKKQKVVTDKLEKDWTAIEEKLRKKHSKNPKLLAAELAKASENFDKKVKEPAMKPFEKQPKFADSRNPSIAAKLSARHDRDAFTALQQIMDLPEKERPAKLKEWISFFEDEVKAGTAEGHEGKITHGKDLIKRLKSLGESEGITKPKLARAIAAVGGALDTVGENVQKGVQAVIPGSGPATSKPSEVVRPPAPAAPAANTPPPAGLPPPPSATASTAASTPPPAGLPPPPSSSTSGVPDTQNPKYLPSQPPASTPPTTPAAPAGQGGFPAAGKGGVVGVGEGGVTVQVEGDLAAGRKWTPQVRPVVAPDARPSGIQTGAPYGTTSPLTPTAGVGQSGKVVTDASGQPKVGFVSRPNAPKPVGGPVTASPPVANPSLLADLVGPITESAKMIGGVVGKGTMDVVAGAAKVVKNMVVTPSAREILQGNQPAKPATPPPAKPTAKTEADKLPKYAYGYDPATGKQTGGPATKATYGDVGRRVSAFRDTLVPYLNGRNAAELRGEIAGKHGAYDLESFIQKAANKSGMFTASEVGQVVQQLKGDPMFKGLVDAGLPVDRPKGPFKAGGAPKKVVKDGKGNVLPVGNTVPKATPPAETAADRLAKIRAEATAKFTQENAALAAAEAERKAIIDAFQQRSPAGNEPAWDGTERVDNGSEASKWKGTPWAKVPTFTGRPSGVTRQDRLRQIAIENKKGVTPLEVKYARATGGHNENLYGNLLRRTLSFGEAPPSAGAQAVRSLAGTAVQGVGFAPDVFNAARLLRGGAITPDGQILSQTEQMGMAIDRIKNLGKPAQPVDETPWYVRLGQIPVEMAQQSWDDIQAIGGFGKYNLTPAQKQEQALQRFVDEAAVRQIYGVPPRDEI